MPGELELLERPPTDHGTLTAIPVAKLRQGHRLDVVDRRAYVAKRRFDDEVHLVARRTRVLTAQDALCLEVQQRRLTVRDRHIRVVIAERDREPKSVNVHWAVWSKRERR